MTRLVAPWRKTRLGLGVFVVAMFFLPFFGISCDGMDAVTISGVDMVGGCRPGGLITAAADQSAKQLDEPGEHHRGGGHVDATVPNVDIEPLAIAAFGLAVLGVALAFLGTRKALLGAVAAAALGVACLGVLYITESKKLRDAIDLTDEGHDAGHEHGIGKQLTRDTKVDTGGRMGLWGAAAGFLALGYFSVRTLRQKPNDARKASDVAIGVASRT